MYVDLKTLKNSKFTRNVFVFVQGLFISGIFGDRYGIFLLFLYVM